MHSSSLLLRQPGRSTFGSSQVTAPCSEVALPLLLAATELWLRCCLVTGCRVARDCQYEALVFGFISQVQGKCQGRSLTGLTLDSADEEKEPW